jgi:hypothetical protein
MFLGVFPPIVFPNRLRNFLDFFLTNFLLRPIWYRMGFLRNPKAFLMVLKAAIESTDYMFILFSSGYKPLDSAIQSIASSVNESRGVDSPSLGGDSALLFNGRLFCFLGWVLDWCYMFALSCHVELVVRMLKFSDQYRTVGFFLGVQPLFTMLAGNGALKFLSLASAWFIILHGTGTSAKDFIFLLLW